MSLKKGLPLVLLLASAGTLEAREIDFNYVEGTIGIFDLDFDESAPPIPGLGTISLESDDDVSYDFRGAWQPWKGNSSWLNGVHLFGALGFTENDLELSITNGGTTTTTDGSVDIFRARGGVGYGFDLNEQWNLYGRLTWDYVELEDLNLGGASSDDVDDDGVGFEIGARWMINNQFELQGYGRYTDVGELDDDGEADDDILLGLSGRWYFADRWALIANGEFGETMLYGAGVRFDF